MRTAWLLVVVAGLLETGFAISLKAQRGLLQAGSRRCRSPSARSAASPCSAPRCASLPVGPAYAVWTGIGAAGTALVGIVVLGESAATLKLLSIVLIVAGVVGLQLTSQGAH